MTTIESAERELGTAAKLRDIVSALRLALPRATSTPATRSFGRSVATWTTGIVAILALWAVVFSVFISRFQYAHSQRDLYGQFREQLSAETAPLGGAIMPGKPVSVLSIPAIGARNLVVVEGTASGDLENGPGHRRDTALPGQYGTSVIYGRSGLYGAPLKRVGSLKPGDSITATTGQGEFTYVVERIRRAGDAYVPDLPSSGGRLTFVTSDSSGWRSGWAPTGTLYVDAALKGKTVIGAPGRPALVPRTERAMQADPTALYTLVLWLGLLVIVSLGAVYGFSAWGRWNTWLVGVPAVLAALWGTTEAASQLLPNLM